MLTDGDGKSTLKPTDSTTRRAALTKTDLIEEVSRVLEIPRKEAAIIVECILDSIVRAIHRGDKVEIRGFGSFRTRQRGARIGRNPKTGVRVEVPAKRIAFFKSSQELGKLTRFSHRVEDWAEIGEFATIAKGQSARLLNSSKKEVVSGQ